MTSPTRTSSTVAGPGYRCAVANEAETRRWNHPGWVAAWPERERLTDAVTAYVLKVVDARSGQRIFDVGCGGGSLAIALSEAVAPEGEVVGLDISSALLELARQRAADAGRPNVRFVELDVQTGTLEPGPFDLAVSQFGVMFFDEPTAALTAIKSRLAPEGRLVFACWQSVEHNPWHVGRALRPLVAPPTTPPPGKSPVGPFAFGDEEYVRELLEAAGFGTVHAEPHEATVRGPAEAVAHPSLFALTGVPPEREEEATARLEAHLARFAVGPGEFEYPIAFMIYEATA
jgi:SAM-dependent methyltransferase